MDIRERLAMELAESEQSKKMVVTSQVVRQTFSTPLYLTLPSDQMSLKTGAIELCRQP